MAIVMCVRGCGWCVEISEETEIWKKRREDAPGGLSTSRL